jgi:L-asparaginase
MIAAVRERIASGCCLLAIIASASALPARSMQAEPARVRLIATGGTIAHRSDGRSTAEDLVRAIPELTRVARAEVEQFANIPSPHLTLEQVLELARRVNRSFADDPGLAGIVVSMGTDTLEEVAYLLDLTVADPRPLVVVGSMRSVDAIGYDGGANLLSAFRVAAAPSSRGLGVLVVLNDEIDAARDVTKTTTLRTQTFQTREFGMLGAITPNGVFYARRPALSRTAPRFDPARLDTLPRVEVLPSYLGAAGDAFAAAIRNGARGIVVAGTGAGFMTLPQERSASDAVKQGIVVVMSSRTGAGRVIDYDGNERLGIVTAGDLNPYKARILLMLALTQTTDRRQIQRIFAEY